MRALLACALLAPVVAQGQSLVASNTSAPINLSGAPVTLSYTPGADSGSLDFELRYTALATTSAAQVNSTIANGSLACGLPTPGRLRCTVLAGSAAADLGAGSITILFAAGSTAGNMPITFQSAHFFSQTGAAEPGIATGGSLALVTPPTLSLADVSVVEGNGSTSATFTVSLAPVSAGPVSFDIATDTGTATPGVDYEPKALVGQTIPAGQASATFTVSINGDSNVENNETYTVNLNNVSGAAVADGQALGTILNDDAAGLSIADATMSEGNLGELTLRFKLSLSAPMPTPVTFNIATANGTATAGSDYVARSQVARLIDAGRTTALFEVAVNGDALAEPDESFTVTISGLSGATLVDGVATGTIVNDDGAAVTPIALIQGNQAQSRLVGQSVSTEGVVSALTKHGFFLQATDEHTGDPGSSQGIAVACAECDVDIGDRRRVDGQVQEVQVGRNPDQLTLTRLVATHTVLLGRQQALPLPVELDLGNTGPGQPVTGLERYEGMRISIASLEVVGPSTSDMDEVTGAERNSGRFYGVVRGIPRPFLEPGASVLDGRPLLALTASTRFDANPERLAVDSSAQRGASIVATDVGDSVSGLVGVLSYGNGAYQVFPDPDAKIVVVSGARPRAVPATRAGEATIGSFSLTPGLGSAGSASSPDARARAVRLAKTANAVCAFARSPDILAITGVKDRAALAELADAVNASDGNLLFPGSCHGDPGYRAYPVPSPTAGADNIGFLVRSAATGDGPARVDVVSVTQAYPAATFRGPDGSALPINDHPPLILEARLRREDGGHFAVTVIANALSALSDDPAAPGQHGWRTQGDAVGAKRQAQAAFLGRLVQIRLRTHPAERLVVLGNFEASEFSDGHADLLDIVAIGSAVPHARRQGAARAQRLLTNLATRLPPGERYTVIRDGNAQAVDHVLVNAPLLAASPDARLFVARIDADFGADNARDPGVPMRVSDHDPVVLSIDIGD